jgi:hypothetical protein
MNGIKVGSYIDIDIVVVAKREICVIAVEI